MKRWLAARIPPPVFRAVWWISQLALTAVVLNAWVQLGLDRSDSSLLNAVLLSLIIGLPVALEWRHVDEVRGSAPVPAERSG